MAMSGTAKKTPPYRKSPRVSEDPPTYAVQRNAPAKNVLTNVTASRMMFVSPCQGLLVGRRTTSSRYSPSWNRICPM
jgi:hypothetical protein